MLRARIPRGTPKVPERPRDGMSSSHLADVRALPCLVTGALKNVQAHHLMRSLPPEERGMGRKAADRYSIPLSKGEHDAVHENGDDEAYLAALGIDGRAIADALWRYRGDRGRMFRVIVRSLNARGIYADLAGVPHA